MHVPRTPAQLLVVGLILSGCGGSAAEAPLDVTAPTEQIDPVLSSVEMSVPWLSALDLDPGQIVLVPSDHAVLSLDADALASLAEEDLHGEILEIGTNWDPKDQANASDNVLITVDGRQLPLRVTESETFIDDIVVQEFFEWDGITVVVMDGVFQ
ncbi:MAG: hypothetical protein HKN03_15285 [Acidimicrobiales bacterium]|nr:hypothetical protein [Acidimicrobiales bacterium]